MLDKLQKRVYSNNALTRGTFLELLDHGRNFSSVISIFCSYHSTPWAIVASGFYVYGRICICRLLYFFH